MKHLITLTDKDITGTEELSNAKPRIAVGKIVHLNDFATSEQVIWQRLCSVY